MSDKETIARQRAEFVAAFNIEDTEAMAKFLPDDHVGMPPIRPTIRGLDGARAFWREGFAAAKSRFSLASEELEVIGDVAIDSLRWTMDSTPKSGGKTVHDKGKCIYIWRRQRDGSWKLARAIWNSDLAQAGLWSGAS